MDKKELLVVDDVEMNRNFLRISFCNKYEVLEAENGAEALKVLESADVDMLITDIFMDVMDGYELIVTLRENPKYKNMPIIAITENDAASKGRAMGAGADAFITRPFIKASLNKTVGGLLERDLAGEHLLDIDYLLNSLPGAVIVFMLTGDTVKVKYCSVGIEKISGWTVREFCREVEKMPNGGVYPPDAARVTQAFVRVYDTGADMDVIYRVTHKNGEIIWLWMQGHVIGEENDCPVVEAVLLNISKDARIYENILDETQIMVSVIDTETYELLYSNKASFKQAVQHIDGYEGHTCYSVFDNRDTPCENCVIKHATEDDYYECELTRDGRIYRQVCKIVKWNGRRALMESAEDITELHKNQIYVEKEKHALEDILGNISAGVFVYRVDGGTIEVVQANAAICEMLGIQRSKTVGVNGVGVYTLVHPDDIHTVEDVAQKLKNPGAEVKYEYRSLNRKTGEYIWLSAIGRSAAQEDGSVLIYISYNDITEQKRLDELVVENEQSLKAAIEHNNLLYWTVDIKNDIAYYGERMAENGALPRVLKNFRECILTPEHIYQDDIETYRENLGRVFAGEPFVSWECRRYDANDKRYTWKRINYTVLFNKAGEPYMAVATAQNIQDAKRLENYFLHAETQNDIWTWELDIKGKTLRAIGNGKKRRNWVLGDLAANVPESVIDAGIIHCDSIEAYRETFNKIYSGAECADAEICQWNESKSDYRWYNLVISTVEDESGHRDKAICTTRDITSEKRLEQMYLMEVENRKNIAATMVSSCRINLTKGKIEDLWINGQSVMTEYMHMLTDYRTRMGLVLEKLRLSDEENEELSPQSLLERYAAGTHSWEKTYLANKRVSGRLVWVRAEIRMLVRPDTGDIIAFFYNHDETRRVMNDITSKKIVNSSCDMIGYVVASTGEMYIENYEWDSHNVSHGYQDFEAALQDMAERRVPKNEREEMLKGEHLSVILEKLSKSEIYTTQFNYIDNQGEQRIKQTVYTYGDASREFIVVARSDITDIYKESERKQKELRRALDIATKASNAKSDFLSRMSHDIRTPMNTIINLTSLAYDDVGSKERIEDDLDKIGLAGEFLLGLINDILDMSKIESGKVVLNPTVYLYKDFLKYMEGVIAPLCDSKDIDFVWDRKSDKHPDIYVDKTRFNQVFFNLLSNAVKFTDAGGRIDFRIENAKTENGRFEADFIVADTGCGMSSEFMSRMYQPFERADTTAAYQGTGLGLSITKSIVDLMGGSIKISSEIGKGTSIVVHFSLPCATNEELKKSLKEDNKIHKLHTPGCVLRVLVAEDHPLNQEIICRLLNKGGYSVECVSDGKAAVEKFSASPTDYYDAVLMDIRMPEMDGLTATKRIRALDREDAKRTPIIAMTANAFDDDAKASIAAGMNAHLSKPIVPNKLFSTLAQYIGK